MFVRRGSKWNRSYDNVTDKTWVDRTYNASDYITEDAKSMVNDEEFNRKQAISDVIMPRPDNKVNSEYVEDGYTDDDYVL